MAEATDINVDELRRRARRRLLGAVVLALAAAVLIPMLLESDPKPLGEDVSVRIPAVDNGKFVNRLSDKGGKANANDAPKGESAKDSAKDTAKDTGKDTGKDTAKEAMRTESPKAGQSPADTAAAPTNVPAPKKSIAQAEQKMLGTPAKIPAAVSSAPAAIAPAPAAVAPAPAALQPTAAAPSSASAPTATTLASNDAPRVGFSVQLAAFADDKGANSLANKLKRAAYPAYTEPLTTSKGTLWRVRVGPYPTRDDATVVRDKLKSEGFSGIVAAAK